MAFPTTPILDSFNRTENPLSQGGNWAQGVTTNDGNGTLKDDGTTAVATVDGTASLAHRTVGDYTDCEAYGKINQSGTTSWGVYARVLNGGTASMTGYGVFWDNTNVYITKNAAALAQTIIKQVALTGLTAGDVLGISCVGTTISAYRNGALSTSVVDTAFTHGSLGILVTKGITGSGMSNFGGGSIVSIYQQPCDFQNPGIL